jgi:cobalt-zinc-cadmium efflux system outer membrane protein
MHWKLIISCGLIWVGAARTQTLDSLSLSPSLSLKAAIALALKNHPALEASRSAVASREAVLDQSSRGLNPEISLELEDLAGTGVHRGVDAAQTTVQFSQTVEWSGKRSRRVQVATVEKRLAEMDLRTRRMEIRALTITHFMQALHAERRLSLALEAKSHSERLLEAVIRRVGEGVASKADEIRARLAVTETEMEIRKNRLHLEAAKRKLAGLCGQANSLPPLLDELDSLGKLESLEDLYSKIEISPVSMARSQSVFLAEAKRNLAQSLYGPDIAVSAGVRHIADPGDIALVGGISIPLPLRNRNQGGRAEASHEVARAKSELKATVLELKSNLGDFHENLLVSQDEINTLRSHLIPQAVQAASVLEEGYRRGRFGTSFVIWNACCNINWIMLS